MFFDFHVHGNENLTNEAKRLGYNGICHVRHFNNYSKDISNGFKKINNDNDFIGIEIVTKNVGELKKKIQKFRKETNILLVSGGNLRINRVACEDPRVDILTHPYKGRRDCGINHILAKEAARNNVAIELSISFLLKNRLSHRSRILNQFAEILKLQRKFNFPLIITSGARSIYDLRTPQDIIALAIFFGMSREETINAMSLTPQNIIKRSQIREKVIVKGVKKAD